MGLERHIRETLEMARPDLAFGLDYWFEDGLQTATPRTASEIADALNRHPSGDFVRMIADGRMVRPSESPEETDRFYHSTP